MGEERLAVARDLAVVVSPAFGDVDVLGEERAVAISEMMHRLKDRIEREGIFMRRPIAAGAGNIRFA